MSFLLKLFSGVGSKIAGVAIAASALLGSILLFKKAGKDEERADNLEEILEDVSIREQVEDDIANLNDDDILKRLRESGWVRKSDLPNE